MSQLSSTCTLSIPVCFINIVLVLANHDIRTKLQIPENTKQYLFGTVDFPLIYKSMTKTLLDFLIGIKLATLIFPCRRPNVRTNWASDLPKTLRFDLFSVNYCLVK